MTAAAPLEPDAPRASGPPGPPSPPPEAELGAAEARRLALRAQGLLGAGGRQGGVAGVLRRVGAVQLDTISVLARSHELVPYARLGGVGREVVETTYWGHRPARSVEYWSHAACILPVEEWPWFAFRRRERRRAGRRWHRVDPRACREVRARLETDGPLTASDLGGAKAGGPWWDWSDAKVAVEWLLDVGEVVVTERRGWRRVYDLPARALPASVLGEEPSDADCRRRLVRLAGEAMGVATVGDLADYHRLGTADVHQALPDTGLVPVRVAGWEGTAWADPDALAHPARGRHRTTLLSPFDSLVWHRPRTRRVFGFTHLLEAYKPAAQRVYGYFAMPVLAGGRLVGRVDPAREGRTLVARRTTLEGGRRAVDDVADALVEAAAWVGCDDVRVEEVRPDDRATVLVTAVRERTA
jgi:uncharacterized protein